MTFVNQYTKPPLILRNASTFLELNDHFLYAVGHGDNYAAVIKTDFGKWKEVIERAGIKLTE